MVKNPARDERLIRKGRQIPLQALRREARRAMRLGQLYPDIGVEGWTLDRQGELERKLVELNDRKYDQVEAQALSRETTRQQEMAIDEFKPFKRRLVAHVRTVVRRQLVPDGVDTRSIFKSGTLNRSPSRIYAYLIDNLPVLEKLDALLEPYFQGERVSVVARGIAHHIAETDTVQEIARGSTPRQTRALRLLKGEVLELVEELLACGRLRFEGNAPVQALFGNDRLQAAKRGKPLPADEGELEPGESEVA